MDSVRPEPPAGSGIGRDSLEATGGTGGIGSPWSDPLN